MKPTALTELLDIRVPIVQGGMTWVSRHGLAAAVSEAGGLGILGAGGMEPDELADEIVSLRSLTREPFGVNIPLLSVRPDGREGVSEQLIDVAIRGGAPIVVTGAGSPRRYTERLHAAGVLVMHVVPSVEMARKALDAGVDVIVAESSDAGGHVRSDGLSTFSLLPQVVDAVDVPVLAAGGIADARGMVAALALGAAGVQLGTRFVATVECNAHVAFKEQLLAAGPEGAPMYSRDYHASRGLASPAVRAMIDMEREGRPTDEIVAFRGRGRAYQGCIEGDVENGILPAGTGVGLVHDLPTVAQLIDELVHGATALLEGLRPVDGPVWPRRDRGAA